MGCFTFNRREWRKNPTTGRRVYRWRPKEQWEEQVFEDLRIIDEETWEKVQTRLDTRRHLFAERKSRTTHLLSGLLICHRCGGRYSVIGQTYYGCRNHFESDTCPNDIRIRREAIESLVISLLIQNLPNWLDTIRAAATRRSRPARSDAVAHPQRLKTLRQQADAIMAVVRVVALPAALESGAGDGAGDAYGGYSRSAGGDSLRPGGDPGVPRPPS